MKNLFIILCSVLSVWCSAQSVDDSAKRRDTATVRDSALKVPVARDTISRDSVVRDSIRRAAYDSFLKQLDTAIYSRNPFFRFTNPTRMVVTKRYWNGKEDLFYALVALLLLHALAKNAFPRYIDDLYRVFFRTTLKQRQKREQLTNAPLPSLLFNILFVLSAGFYIVLLLRHFRLGTGYSFWELYAYSVGGLIIIYSVKFLVLKILGWILRVSDATDTYIFVVFTTNKLIGILLLPFIIGLAFTTGMLYEAAYLIGIGLAGAMILYRFYLSFVTVRKGLKINFFHFVLYLAAFEVAPLLLINKLLLKFLG